MNTDETTMKKALELGFDEALEATQQALSAEGFGILTEIDVAATLKKKLDVDFPPYRILGACHPPSAHRALSAEPAIGVMLPCNVVVRATDGGTEILAFDPMAMAGEGSPEEVREVATDVRERLSRVLASL